MKTKQIDIEIERLTMLKNRSELTENGIELLDELISVKEQLRLYGVVKSLPTKIIIDYLERSEDFYIDDSEIANRFYNAALNDVKYFIKKEEEELK